MYIYKWETFLGRQERDAKEAGIIWGKGAAGACLERKQTGEGEEVEGEEGKGR
jgi:hypothetical protein